MARRTLVFTKKKMAKLKKLIQKLNAVKTDELKAAIEEAATTDSVNLYAWYIGVPQAKGVLEDAKVVKDVLKEEADEAQRAKIAAAAPPQDYGPGYYGRGGGGSAWRHGGRGAR